MTVDTFQSTPLTSALIAEARTLITLPELSVTLRGFRHLLNRDKRKPQRDTTNNKLNVFVMGDPG